MACVAAPVTIHEALICAGDINKSQTRSVHDWRIGCCAEAEGGAARTVLVRAAGGGLLCSGVRGGVLYGYVRAPFGPILKFIHSFIHDTGMSSDHQRAAGYTRAPCGRPCLLLHDEQHAGVCRRIGSHVGAVWCCNRFQLNCTSPTGSGRETLDVCGIQVPQINHMRV